MLWDLSLSLSLSLSLCLCLRLSVSVSVSVSVSRSLSPSLPLSIHTYIYIYILSQHYVEHLLFCTLSFVAFCVHSVLCTLSERFRAACVSRFLRVCLCFLPCVGNVCCCVVHVSTSNRQTTMGEHPKNSCAVGHRLCNAFLAVLSSNFITVF